MKNIFKILLIILATTTLGACTLNQKTNDNQSLENQLGGYGRNNGNASNPSRGNCLAEDCLIHEDLEYPVEELEQSIIDALDTAIDDEYKARATYESVINKHGSIRPFIMIIRAEEQHISSLKSIYDKYGVDIPKDAWTGNVLAPETLIEACQVGVDAEIENAKLYEEKLLPVVSQYEDISGVFTNLMNASKEKHLPAFDRCN